MAVEFEDFSLQIKAALNDQALAFLEEAAGEIETAVHRKSRNDTGDTREHWSHRVNESALEVTIGNPYENAIWEEFGTGEYAAEGNGRKGGWYVPAEKLTPKAKSKMQKVIINGKEFYRTRGKKPNHTLQKSFDSKKAAIVNRAKQIFGELGS